VAPSGFTISSAAFAQDQLYTNGGLNYNLRGYGTVGSNQQNSGAAHTNGEKLFPPRNEARRGIINAVYLEGNNIQLICPFNKGLVHAIYNNANTLSNLSILLTDSTVI